MSQEDMFRELRKISKVLTLSNAPAIEKELSKIASTKERKRMWIYLDGKRMQKEIADKAKVTPQAVGQFLNAGVALELIEYEKGKPPRRLLDYVPPEWLSHIEIPTEPEGSTGDDQSTLATQNKKEEDAS
jgi:hypothetical protein